MKQISCNVGENSAESMARSGLDQELVQPGNGKEHMIFSYSEDGQQRRSRNHRNKRQYLQVL